jgi:predicted secreted protein
MESVNQSVSQSINQSINQSIDQSINQSIRQSISQSVSQSVNIYKTVQYQVTINIETGWPSSKQKYLINSQGCMPPNEECHD